MKTIVESSSELSSSIHAVESNDDLLIEMLLRSPFSSLHLFKSVCKRWLTLITNPNFTRNPTLDPPSGLLLRRHTSFQYDFIPFDVRIPANRFSLPPTFTLDFNSGNAEILQSCNGLILCRMNCDHNLYVYNPITNRYRMIPQCPHPNCVRFIGGLRLAFDPSKSPHYKIVYAGDVGDHSRFSIRLQIYSSETHNWSVCDDRFSAESFIGFEYEIYRNDVRFRGFKHGIFWNNAVHWLEFVKGDLHFKLDVDDLVLASVKTPRTSNGTMHCYQKMFESCGCLLLVCAEDIRSLQLKVYQMRKWCCGWVLKYVIDLDDIMMRFPKTWRRSSKWFCSSVGCVVIEKNEEDSFVVMEIYGKIVEYKIVSKSICKLYDLGSVHSKVSFQFIASSAGV